MKSPVKVLQFITPSGFYGAERWLLALARNSNPQIIVYDLAVTRECPDQDLSLAELYPTDNGQRVHYLDMNGRFDVGVIARLSRVIREQKIDIIHTHGYKSDLLGWIMARRTGIPCVSTPHGFPGKTSWKMDLFIKVGVFSLRHFDRVVPLSGELLSDMKRFGVPSDRTRFIRNGVDLSEIDDALSDLPRIEKKEDVRTIGYIGQIIPRKGLSDLLAVFDCLHQKNSNLTLRLVGDGSQRVDLEHQADNLQSRSAISFLGFRADRLELLAEMDLFVMTSSLEGIPRCLMEAMAVGVPVVAYDIPGVDQLVTHGETGLLAPLGDKDALERCCREILANQDLARKLIANGRRLIEEQYSAARMAREYESLFEELVSEVHKPLGKSEQVR